MGIDFTLIDGYLWESNYFVSRRAAAANFQLGKGLLNEKVSQMTKSGIAVTDLSGYIVERPYGEIESPSKQVLNLVKESFEKGWPMPERRGIFSLRQVIGEVEGRDKGIDVDP